MDIDVLPTRPVPASMQKRSTLVFEGIDPKHPACPRWDDMPSTMLVLIIILVLVSACHGKRKTIETISMSQHQRQEIWYHDTLWQQLNLCLDGITMEWQVDSSKGKQGTLMRIQAEHAELGTQCQSHAELKVEAHHADTVATHRKVVETNPRESASAGAWRVWGIVVLLLLVIAVVAYLWWRKR